MRRNLGRVSVDYPLDYYASYRLRDQQLKGSIQSLDLFLPTHKDSICFGTYLASTFLYDLRLHRDPVSQLPCRSSNHEYNNCADISVDRY